MTFPQIDSMKSTGFVLDLIAKKQKAIGENLSNIDTPGYARKDVNFGTYLAGSDGTLETKLSAKLGQSVAFDENTGQPVVAANELMELQKNAILYMMATKRMSNIITQMKTVTRVGS
jgi:flagellar basal-body rod protein FlgB